MKAALKIVVAALVIAALVPVVKYRTVRPCGMLEKELVQRTEDALQAARDTVRQATAPLGDRARETADAIASSVEDLAAGIAAAAVHAKVERMSAPECGKELVRMTFKNE